MRVAVIPSVGREPVGTIEVRVGIQLVQGVVTGLTPRGLVVLDGRRQDYAYRLLVRLDEAIRWGWPSGPGCSRHGRR